MEKKLKTIPFEIKDINEQDRTFLAVASTEAIDRDNDRIMSEGWDLKNFKKNPVIPWAHRYSDPPVAQATAIKVVDKQLEFKPKFATKEEYPFADTIFNLYKGGFLRSFSVGFKPKRWESVDRDKKGMGVDFLEQELWEISACTVPSNPEALIAAKAHGVISDSDFEALTKILDDETLDVEKIEPNQTNTTGNEDVETEPDPDSKEIDLLEMRKELDNLKELTDNLHGMLKGLAGTQIDDADLETALKGMVKEPELKEEDIREQAQEIIGKHLAKAVGSAINNALGIVDTDKLEFKNRR